MCSKCKICATFEVNLMESVTFDTFSTTKQKVLKHFIVYVNRMCKVCVQVIQNVSTRRDPKAAKFLVLKVLV